MKNKTLLSKIKTKFYQDLFIAKQNGFEAVLLPICCDADPYCLHSIEDEEELMNIAEDFGWEHFAFIDFSNDTEDVFNLYDAA